LAADPGGPTYADALRQLFALDSAAVDAVTAPKTTGGEPA
jgi:glutamyl-tRNA reductase